MTSLQPNTFVSGDSVADMRKKQLYISKLKHLSKQLASPPPNEATPTASPQRSDSKSIEKECPQQIDTCIVAQGNDTQKQKEAKQMRAFKKLKALISKMESESPKSSAAKTFPRNTNCITPDSNYTRPRSTTEKLNSSKDEKSSFSFKGLLQCCGEMNVQDMFSEDDDIDQLLMDRECDDTTLLNESSFDVSSVPSGESRRDMDSSNAIYNTGNSEFFRGEPCEI